MVQDHFDMWLNCLVSC